MFGTQRQVAFAAPLAVYREVAFGMGNSKRRDERSGLRYGDKRGRSHARCERRL
jgi:hypothetical protein